MNEKTLSVLEYNKIVERLAAHCTFSASADLACSLTPTPSFELAKARIAETSEARHLLSVNDSASVGGARDVREKVTLAARGGILETADLLDIKGTLVSARRLKTLFEK
ncbi:endonuclease MutS2, partial [bacterium]|nr:endonuclease MutS2 [bacterium]